MKPQRWTLLAFAVSACVLLAAPAAWAGQADDDFFPLPGQQPRPPRPKGKAPQPALPAPALAPQLRGIRWPQAIPAPAQLPVPEALGRPFPLQRAPQGHIIFSRHIIQKVSGGGLTSPVSTSKLYVANADGSGARPFLVGGRFDVFSQPRWSPRYARLCFTSNFQGGHSACYSDIFFLTADGTRMQRVTGNPLHGPSPHGWAAVTGTIRDNVSKDKLKVVTPTGEVDHIGTPFSRLQINIAVQGAGPFIYHPQPPVHKQLTIIDPVTGLPKKIGDRDMKSNEWQYKFVVPRCAAGYVWIRVWTDRWIGNIKFVNLKAGKVNDIGAFALNHANYLASQGTVTPDGRFTVGVGSIASYSRVKAEDWDPSDSENKRPPALPKHTSRSGADNIAVYRTADGTPLAMFEPTRARGENASDPALSPDGQWIACSWGRFSAENLAVLSLQSLLANQPQMRVIVPGRYILPVVGCRNPAWSPDGRMLAFSRVVAPAAGLVSGNVCIVGVDGAGIREVTKVGANQLACQPCFSPDGQHIVFTVMTTKHPGPMRIEHLILQHVTVNLFTVHIQSGRVQQITNDGMSWEPAWGL